MLSHNERSPIVIAASASADGNDRRSGSALPTTGSDRTASTPPQGRLTVAPMREALIFIHLYKTGGTTLNRIIEWEYKLSKICSVEPNWWRWSYQRITRWSPARMAGMDVFKGHMPFGLHAVLPRNATYITVLRDPVERVISDYYFARRFKAHQHHRAARELTLEEFFLQKHEHNLQSRILAGQNSRELFPSAYDASVLATAKDHLAGQFAVVGLTERFDETLALLKVILGWKVKRYRSFRVADNRVPKRQISPKTMALIHEWERFDIALYDYATTLFDTSIAAHREAVEAALPAIRAARNMTRLESRYYWMSSVFRAVICRAQSLL